ncbi:four helix bundle protein [Pontixanthobacter gangjinensis]|uniref:Four helix bundle protein n=1 Tax=Christiangramia aestuarii TaxID=1028746 RepID=A0A7K1LSJ1_9FLAO|nr:four helix bundle protein [Christiangramia aestuarii]MUP43772.1 four helix bundle protein [Christiangramia aestuarii]
MAHYQNFEELEIYRLARSQCKQIWKLINETGLAKDYKLKEQINGSSGSVMDNIAEGFGRGGNKEFIQFLSFARGSNHETRAQLQRALDRNHISLKDYEDLINKSEIISEQISKFMNYLKSSDKKGSKYD